MQITNIAPKVSSTDFKRTKIIATIGPATNSFEAINKLIKAGVNGLRLNFSHGTYEERDQQIDWIRQASLECSKPVAIIQDLQGPKMRLGDFDGIVQVHNGQSLSFRFQADYERENVLPTQYDLSKKVKRGERIFLFDGKICATITSIKNDVVFARADNDGILLARKGINLPDTDFEGDILTDKDKKDIAYGVDHDVDFVALSFVQTVEDIKHLKRLLKNLGSNAKIIAKIETRAATEDLNGIIQEADAVMVARGDLAIETKPEAVPILQRKIIALGLKYGRPSIVATQMLAGMVDSAEPTRAEVSDVATAVMLGADTIMLSDETATGKFPIQSVKVMRRIIKYTENNTDIKPIYTTESESVCDRQSAISRAIITLADSIEATAIVAETKSGATALKIAAQRPQQPIIVVTSSLRVAQQLSILYGCISFIRKDEITQAAKLTNWLLVNKVLKKGDIIVTASGQHPGVVGTTDTIKVRALE